MPIYTYRGATIDVAKGRQTATATRVEIRDGDKVIQSQASAAFRTVPDVYGVNGERLAEGITAQVQAERWVKALPLVEDDTELDLPPVAEAATAVEDDE